MRRVSLLLAVLISLFALAQVGQTADLAAGSYVKLGLVGLSGVIPQSPYYTATDWSFVGDLGTYGPFEVSSPDPVWAERMVSVPTSVTGVSAGTSVYLWGQPVDPVYYAVDSVSFYWETNFDKSVIQLELLSYNSSYGYTKLWSYSQSPYNSGFDNVLTFPQKIPVGYVPVFRVSVVPEPNGVIVLLTGAGAMIGLLRRRS